MTKRNTPKNLCYTIVTDMLKEENLNNHYCLDALEEYLRSGRLNRNQLEKFMTFVARVIETACGNDANPSLYIVLPCTSSPRADHTTPNPETSDAGPV